MRGLLPYSSLRVKHLELVRAEIVVRGGTYDSKEKLKVLAKQLKDFELKEQRETYKRKNGIDARNNELNQKAFRPKASSVDDYNLLVGDQ